MKYGINIYSKAISSCWYSSNDKMAIIKEICCMSGSRLLDNIRFDCDGILLQAFMPFAAVERLLATQYYLLLGLDTVATKEMQSFFNKYDIARLSSQDISQEDIASQLTYYDWLALLGLNKEE